MYPCVTALPVCCSTLPLFPLWCRRDSNHVARWVSIICSTMGRIKSSTWATTPYCCGRCRIRTYGTSRYAGFQDQCIRPLCQSSKRSPWANLPDKRGFGSFGVSTILEVNPYLYPYNCSFTTSLCEPDRIRTCDRLLRRQMLYPAELRVHSIVQYNTLYLFHLVPRAGIEPARTLLSTGF